MLVIKKFIQLFLKFAKLYFKTEYSNQGEFDTIRSEAFATDYSSYIKTKVKKHSKMIS
jgi:hypothetical protein